MVAPSEATAQAIQCHVIRATEHFHARNKPRGGLHSLLSQLWLSGAGPGHEGESDSMQFNGAGPGAGWTLQAAEMAQTKAGRLKAAGFPARAPGELGTLPTALPATAPEPQATEPPATLTMPNEVDMAQSPSASPPLGCALLHTLPPLSFLPRPDSAPSPPPHPQNIQTLAAPKPAPSPPVPPWATSPPPWFLRPSSR